MHSAIVRYRPDPGLSPQERLQRFLEEHYGLTQPLRFGESGLVELVHVHDALPDEMPETSGIKGPNAARAHIRRYVEALPPTLQMRPVRMHPDQVLRMIYERSGFYSELATRLSRVCKGGPKYATTQTGEPVVDADGNPVVEEPGCEHFDVCPFHNDVAGLRVRDREPCAVEVSRIQNAVKAYVSPDDGRKPIVDPRRPEIALLFEELLILLVQQERIMLTMKAADVMIPGAEKFRRADGSERAGELGVMEHPLHASLRQVTDKILKVQHAMGIEPKFLKQMGDWESEEDREDLVEHTRREALALLRAEAVTLRRQMQELEARRRRGEDVADKDLIRLQLAIEMIEATAGQSETERSAAA